MAMTIMNDSSTAMTLGELNKNINKLGKSLAKLSKGQKIVSASDDSASFAISERMREQIRSLEQDVQNIQNGSSMLKTAHGGIENIVDELRSLKELAINAANDSNTDEDRAIMQKEFDQRRATIDEIATWTNYNGKTLLDGKYFSPQVTHETRLGEVETRTVVVGTRIEKTHYPGDQYKSVERITIDNTVSGLADSFASATNVQLLDGMKAENDILTLSPAESYDKSICKKGFKASSTGSNTKVAVKVDFSSVKGANGKSINFADEASVANLNEQGFTILCGGCNQFINIKFDTESADTTYGSAAGVNGSRQYTIGLADFGTTQKEFIERIFTGIKNASGRLNKNRDTDNSIVLDSRHDVRMAQGEDGNYYFLKDARSPTFCFYDKGLYQERVVMKTGPERIVNNVINEEQEISIQQFQEIDVWSEGNPLWVQHGTKANQRINIYINDMRNEALGINVSNVTTRDEAKSALIDVDNAILYALDEATNVGAYLQRLEYTEANVTTQEENTQGAESTIRDADMAKEMTEYTKNNVLSQAAQSMLAQANQNMSSILGLLQ